MNEVASAVRWGDFSFSTADYIQPLFPISSPLEWYALSSRPRGLLRSAGRCNLVRCFLETYIKQFCRRAKTGSCEPLRGRWSLMTRVSNGSTERAKGQICRPGQPTGYGSEATIDQPSAMAKEASRLFVPDGFPITIGTSDNSRERLLQRSNRSDCKGASWGI